MVGPTTAVAAGPSGSGPSWYTRTTTALRVPLPLVTPPRPGAAPAGSHLDWLTVQASTETWVSRDGTLRTRTIALSRRCASPADRTRWLASKQPVLPRPAAVDGFIAGDGRLPPQLSTGGPDAGDGLFSAGEVGAARRRAARPIGSGRR